MYLQIWLHIMESGLEGLKISCTQRVSLVQSPMMVVCSTMIYQQLVDLEEIRYETHFRSHDFKFVGK